jgi:Ethanolamine utilization protein EutJ (predicted chaperonin)
MELAVAAAAGGLLLGVWAGYVFGYVRATAKGAALLLQLASRWGSQLRQLADSLPPGYAKDMVRATIVETDIAQLNAAEVVDPTEANYGRS